MADPNPLFPEAPTVIWQLQEDGDAMAQSHEELRVWIRGVVAAQGMAENEDNAPNIFTATAGGINFPKELTAQGGFFIVIMRAPQGWGHEDLPLAFSCKDLYLLGFMKANTWYFFKDADLTGSGHDAPGLGEGAWAGLGFPGGYRGDKFNTVELGMYELWLTYKALLLYPEPSRNEIENALFRIIVVISEAVRFPEWSNQLTQLFRREWDPETVDMDKKFSLLFNDWSSIGKRVRDGENAFVPGDGFATYLELLNSITVILNN
ncbi:hypothetical protein ACP70R_028467 [Stipagrostis hirtigluma subsp. patula]